MSEATIWWMLSGTMVAIELVTGTLYLLLISLGLASGAVAAHLGLPMPVQIFIAAVVGGGSVVVWGAYKRALTPVTTVLPEQQVNLDIGETVHIDKWSEDFTSSAKYRGANWQVSLKPGETAATGAYRIAEVAGNRLVVTKI